MSGPVAARTADGSRLHLQHGPIDLIIEAWGDAADVAEAYRQAWDRFQPLLDELVAELPTLRRPLDDARPRPASPVGRRMAAAVRPFSIEARASGASPPPAFVPGSDRVVIVDSFCCDG